MSTMMEYQQTFGKINPNAPLQIKSLRESGIIDLASGFCTYYDNDFEQTKPDDSEVMKARELTLSKTIPRETYGLAYNTNTTNLFNLYYNDFQIKDDFDYREQLFVNFLSNLGGPTLRNFIQVQLKNQYLSPSHVLYLQETMDLLLGRTDRRLVANESWSSLLYHETRDYTSAISSIKDLLGPNYPVVDARFDELISLWLETSAGMDDLIWFNKLVWGRPLPGRFE